MSTTTKPEFITPDELNGILNERHQVYDQEVDEEVEKLIPMVNIAICKAVMTDAFSEDNRRLIVTLPEQVMVACCQLQSNGIPYPDDYSWRSFSKLTDVGFRLIGQLSKAGHKFSFEDERLLVEVDKPSFISGN